MSVIHVKLDQWSLPIDTLKSPSQFVQEIMYASDLSTDLLRTLSSLNESDVLTPGSALYAEKCKRWATSSERPAGAIILAASSADVSAAVVFAHTHSIDLAIRGGGHSFTGASSSAGGIVIDLSLMRKVSVDPKAKTITAQGGCIWADVDEAAGAHGLATVGGTVNHTGVGGLTLGGGYGWLSGLHGLAIDNLLSVEIVLANGLIVTASSTLNTDLFWAIRGAGHSFGVATSFTFRAHEQSNPVFAGTLAFLPNKLPEIIAFANAAHAASKGELGMILGFAAPPPLFAPCIMAAVFYNGPESKARDAFASLLALEPLVNTTAMVPYSTVNSMLNPAGMPGGRVAIKGMAFATPVRASFMQSVFEDYATFITQMPDAIRTIMLFEFTADAKICAVPHDAMAFANRGHHQNVMVGPKWSDEANDEVCREWVRRMAGRFGAEMRERKEGGLKLEVEGVGQYLNYDGMGERAEVLFGGNFERVRGLKRRFDPGNLFDKACLRA